MLRRFHFKKSSRRRLLEAAFASLLAACGDVATTSAPTPAVTIEAPPAVEATAAIEPTVVAEPPPDPAHPTMGATRAEATPIAVTETAARRERGAVLVPQVVHRSTPSGALAAGDRVYVWGSRRFTIVERSTGAVREWGTRSEEASPPRAIDFAPDGSELRVSEARYDDPYQDEIDVGGPGGSHSQSVPEHSVVAFVDGGIASAERVLHLYTSDFASERTIELEWATPATRMVVSPDRRLVALENEDGDLRIVQVVRGAIVARLHAEPWAPLVALRDAEATERARAAAEHSPAHVEEDLTAGPPPAEPSAHRAWVALAFSLDGSRFAAVRGDGLARILDLTTSHPLAAIEPTADAGATDVTRAGFNADASGLGFTMASGPPRYFVASSGEAWPDIGRHNIVIVREVYLNLVPPPPFDPAPLLAAPTGGEHSVWRALAIPGIEAFLVATRSDVTVVGPDVVRAIHCIDGEAPLEFDEWPALAIQDRGTCDLRTDTGPEFELDERLGYYGALSAEDDDEGEYDEVEEEPEVTVVRGLLAVLGERGRRTRVPGTEGISEDDVRIVELPAARLLIADDGVSARVFRLDGHPSLALTLGPSEAPYRATPTAFFSSGPTHWRALAPTDGHELAQLALDEGHAGVTPTPCSSPDGRAIAVGIGVTLHVFDATWQERATLAMPAANGACVHGDRVLVQRSHGVVEVWSLSEARRTAVWSVETDSLVSVRLGLALALRGVDVSEGRASSTLDVVDLREGRVLLSLAADVLETLDQATLSSDGRFVTWPQRVTARVVRIADGASIDVGIVRSGREVHPYAVADDGAFSTAERSLDLFRVREAGPFASAALLDAAATRARFYRPTLLSDFMHDRPLPTAGAGASDTAAPAE